MNLQHTATDLHGDLTTAMTRPLLSLTLSPATEADGERLERGLRILAADDPTLQVSANQVTGTCDVGRIGELQLEIVVDRLEREFRVSAGVTTPRVVYREARTSPSTDHERGVLWSARRSPRSCC
jgi:translation elongation factor EF-G